MTTETKFEARGYRGEADLQPVCDLLNTCVTTDLLVGEPYRPVQIRAGLHLTTPEYIADRQPVTNRKDF